MSDPTPATSRRDFLKTSAAATALSAVPLAGVHAAGPGTLKVGLVGCGGRGTGAALNALNADADVKLYALGDAFKDRLDGSLGQLKKDAPSKIDVTPERCFVGFDAYKGVIEACDVVLLCTPPGFRPAHLKAAVEAGKHVFCEKPMAVDGPGVRSVLESAAVARKKNLNLVSGFCYRYDLAKRETVKRIHDGAVGDVVALHVSYNTGPLWHKGSNPQWSEMEYQMRNWYYFAWLSGDFIVEQHVHNLDKAAWVLKDATPVAATGMGGRQVRTDKKYGHIFDHHAVTFEYANGVRVFSFCRQIPGCTVDVSDHVLGAKGTAELMKHTINGAEKWKYRGDAPNMYQVEHDELFAAVRAGKALNDGVFMAHSTLMGVLGRMATYTGKRVTWEQALNSQESLVPERLEWGPTPTPPVAVPGVTKVV